MRTFQTYGVKKIVTIDPHAYNTFKHEYPEFGLEAEVYHHTELIWKWIQEGRIKPTKEVKEEIAYHDSCYIGRYNNIYDIPRQILKLYSGCENFRDGTESIGFDVLWGWWRDDVDGRNPGETNQCGTYGTSTSP